MKHWNALNGCPICGQRMARDDSLEDMVRFYRARHSSDRCLACGQIFHDAVMASFNALEDTNKQELINGYIIGRLEVDGDNYDLSDFTYDSPIDGLPTLRFFVAVCWHYMWHYGINPTDITDYKYFANILSLAMDYGKEILIGCALPSAQCEIVDACAWAFGSCHVTLSTENGHLLAE